MIVRFAIDPAILSVAQIPNVRHDRLIRLWLQQRIGVLVDVKHEDGVRAFGAAVQKIEDPKIRLLWVTAYAQAVKIDLLRHVRSNASVEYYTPETLKLLAPHIDVLVIDGPDKGQYGGELVRTNKGSTIRRFTAHPSSQVELIRLGLFDRADEITNALELRQQGNIPHKYSIDSIWQERFHRMFHVSQDVYIVDRFICERHDEMDDRSGLARMIEMAKKHSAVNLRNKKITIYAELPMKSGLGMPKAIQNVSEQIHEAIKKQDAAPNPFGQINIQFVPKTWFSNTYKDRYIRFSSVGVIGGGHGLEVFEGKDYTTRGFKSISWNSDIDVCKEVEGALASGSDPLDPVVIFASD